MSPKTQVQQLALETTQESVEKPPTVSSPLLPRKVHQGLDKRRPSGGQEPPSAARPRRGGGPGSGGRRHARTPQPHRAARRYLAAARSPALGPCVGQSVPRASGGGLEGVFVVRTGSQWRTEKDSGEEPRRLRWLPPPTLPIRRSRRCRGGRVLGIAAPRALRSPLAPRLSAGTRRRAGAAKLGRPPASGCMLIRWGGGVPRFLRPTTGAGGWAAAAAGSQGLQLLPRGHSPRPRLSTCAEAAGRRRRRPHRAPGLCVLPAQPSWWQGLSHRAQEKAPHPCYLPPVFLLPLLSCSHRTQD
ncbi:PREDICTED: uncharacterized protein LOC109376343, partial [Hipposideros armiger]|uniref:Uncharacterized protein LOC109376343 n=1 Tax=Hipposideros armiger TaxID=186990 RepID=A0A8B7QHQ4_HIPAR